jgi:hypothetical protein
VLLQEGLARRVEQEQTIWIDDMTANLDAGRFVRTLRLSSRPPKAGTPLPPELATRLIAAVSTGLTPTVNQDLWAAAVDALAFSPVRNQVEPAGRPEQPSQALLDAVLRFGDRLPKLVELFGLDPAEVAKAAKRRPRGGRGGRPGDKGGAKPAGKGGGSKRADAQRQDAGDAAPTDAAPADAAPTAAAPTAAAPTDDHATHAPASVHAAGMSSGGADAPMSESDTVTVPIESAEGPAQVEVPAAAEAVVAASLETDRAAVDDEPPTAEVEAAPSAVAEESSSAEQAAADPEPSSAVEDE